MQLLAQEIDFCTKIERPSKYYKFSVANFEFTGNHAASRKIGDGSEQHESFYLNLELKTPWGIALIDQETDYDDVIKRIKAQNGIAVTCNIIVESTVETKISEFIHNIDELCRLLSLSRATKINWINAERHGKDGEIQEIILKHSIIWPFSVGYLIDPKDPSETALFIEKIYSSYLQLREEYNLDIAIEQFLDANNSTTYLETRGLAAVALIDSLQQIYTSKNKLTKILERFDDISDHIFASLTTIINANFPNLTINQINEIKEKIPELNRKSFFRLLQIWTKNMNIIIPDSELGEIKRTRNSLAHNMNYRSPVSEGKQHEYFRLINFINQVFLRLLGYEGYYIYFNLETDEFERKHFD